MICKIKLLVNLLGDDLPQTQFEKRYSLIYGRNVNIAAIFCPLPLLTTVQLVL
jgi:hypothetical protein